MGKTQSGKTHFTLAGLLEYLRLQYPEAKRYILDSSYDETMEHLVEGPVLAEGDVMPARLRDPAHTLIWRTHHSKLPEEYARWFRQLNANREKQVIVIDEIASITGEAEEELEVLLKQCRKHGGTVVCLTQEIAKVTPTIFRQMTHFAQFFINAEVYDMARARAYLLQSKEEQERGLPDEHGFNYRRTTSNRRYRYFSDVKQFFGAHVRRKRGAA